MTSGMALDGVTWFLHLKDITNKCKHMQNSLTIAGFLQYSGGKFEEAEYFKFYFRHLLCV